MKIQSALNSFALCVISQLLSSAQLQFLCAYTILSVVPLEATCSSKGNTDRTGRLNFSLGSNEW